MTSNISERDADAISRAIGILTDAGYQVEKVGQGKPADHGVEFKLSVNAPTHSKGFDPQSTAAREAVGEIPEFDMAGQPVEGDNDD